MRGVRVYKHSNAYASQSTHDDSSDNSSDSDDEFNQTHKRLLSKHSHIHHHSKTSYRPIQPAAHAQTPPISTQQDEDDEEEEYNHDMETAEDDEQDRKEDSQQLSSRDSSYGSLGSQPNHWNKSRTTHRNTCVDSIMFNNLSINALPREVYFDYFVAKSSDTKVSLRVNGANCISAICRILFAGPFRRSAFNGSVLKNGHSQLNKLNNDKLNRIFYDQFDNDDTQQLPKNCCLININDVVVYNDSFSDILDRLIHTQLNTLQFQKPNFRPSRIIRCKQTYNLISKMIRHKILFKKWFEYVILLSIIANTICLAMVNSGNDSIQIFIEKAEYAFFAIFLVEMMLKMIGFGIYGRYYDSYLRRAANQKKDKRSLIRKCQLKCCLRCKKWLYKLYTKCAMKGLLGKSRQIQSTRNMIRSKSLPRDANFNFSFSEATLSMMPSDEPIFGYNDSSLTNIASCDNIQLDKDPLIGKKMKADGRIVSELIHSDIIVELVQLGVIQKTDLPKAAQKVRNESTELALQWIFATYIDNNIEDDRYFFRGYFPSSWNILDFVIVVSSLFSLLGIGNVTAIRIIRILRPLRTLSRVKSLKLLINTVFSSLGKLSNVLFLMLFLFTILGIVGVQLFSGALHKICFNRQETDNYMSIRGIPSQQYDHLTENDWYNGMNNSAYSIAHIDIYDYCQIIYTSKGCKAGHDAICLDIAPNINSGLTSFDNIGFAILNEFIMITFDGWTHIMYMMQDAVSGFVWIYFFIVTFICSFFALQLNLAVLVTEYAQHSREIQREEAKQAKKQKKKKSRWDKKKKGKKKKRKLIAQPTLIHSPNAKKKKKNKKKKLTKNKRAINKAIRLPQDCDKVATENESEVSPFDVPSYKYADEFIQNEKVEEEAQNGCDVHHEQQEADVPQMTEMECRPSTSIETKAVFEILPMSQLTNARASVNTSFNIDENEDKQREISLSDVENIDHDCNWDEDDDDDGCIAGAPELKENIRSSSPPINKAVFHSFTKMHKQFAKIHSESILTELSSVSSATGVLQKTISIPSTGSSCSPPISPPYSVFKYKYSTSPAPTSTSPRSPKRRKKRSLRKFNTIASIEEFRPTAMTDSLKKLQSEDWKTFKSKTFHASLKKKNVGDEFELRQLSIDPEEFVRQVSISSFAEMIPSLSPRNISGVKREISVDINSSGSRESSNKMYTTNIKTQMRFRVTVNHEEQTEKILRENYNFSKTAITEARPQRSPIYRDTSNRFVQAIYRICINPWFDSILLVCILTNTVIMALEWPYMEPYLEKQLELTNNIFTIIFFGEMMFKIVGFGWSGYWGDNFNKFDFIIVVVSMMDLMVSFIIGAGTNDLASSLSVFRSLRLLRLFRIMRIFRVVNKIESLRVLTATLSKAVADVSYLCIIPFLLVFMFATLGVSLFSTDYANIDETKLIARHSFKNIWLSMITVFQVVSGDNWTGIMYSNAEVTGNTWSFLFFLAIVIFGDFVLMNLFVAVLLTKIHETSAETNDTNQWLIDALTERAKDFYNQEMRYQEKILKLCTIAQQLRFQKQLHNLEILWLPYYKKKIFTQKYALIGKSLGIFSTHHTIRCRLYSLVHSSYFEWFIAVMIVINCAMLALETPQMKEENPNVIHAMEIVDAVFVCIYSLEMLFKVIADGFIAKPLFDTRDWQFVNVYADEAIEFNQKWTDICKQYIKSYVQLPEDLVTECGKILNCTQSRNGYTAIHFMSADKNMKHFRMIFYNADDDETVNQEIKPVQHNNMYDKLSTTDHNGERYECNSDTSVDDTADDYDSFVMMDDDEYDDFGTSIPQLKHIYKLSNPLTGEWQYVQYSDDSCPAPHSFCAVLFSPQMSNLRQGAYLHDHWNIMDALVVMISIISMLFPNSIGYFRVLRAIRPLRLAIRFESLRVAITSLIYSIPGVISTIGFILLFWMALAILGVNLMCATFMRCSITDAEILATIITRADCENAGGEWINAVFNFDNVFKSIQSIFIVALRVNWSYIMWNAVDSVGVDMQPQYNHRLPFSLYFIFTVLIAGMFTFNLLISVVVDNFQVTKDKQCGGSLFLTEAQKQWVGQRLITGRIDITKDYEYYKRWTNYRFRRFIFDICQHPKFDIFIMICIVLNTLQMCLEHYQQADSWTVVLMYLNIMFIAIFTIEAMLKIIGYGFKQYWNYDHWNKFDFILVIVSLVDLILAYVLPFVISSDINDYRFGFNVLRILRVGRALRLIKKANTLRMMFLTLYYSLPSLFNVGALIFILMFIYAIIGMNVFGSLQHEDAINEFVNFATFPNAMQTLYRIGTLDSWNDIYKSCARTAAKSVIAAIFFLSYTILTTLILINVFIAVILENFVQIQNLQEKNEKLQCIRAWTAIWNKLDINPQRKYLSVEAFLYSMVITPFPVGVLSRNSIESLHLYNKDFAKRINNLNQRISNKCISAKEKHVLEQRRFKVACQYCLHHAHDPKTLKEKFLKRMKKIHVNLLKTYIPNDEFDECCAIWSVSFEDVAQALSAMIVGPMIQAIVTDPETERPLKDWLMDNCDTYLDIFDSFDPLDDDTQIEEDEHMQPQHVQQTFHELKAPHVSASQYKDFIYDQNDPNQSAN